MSKYKYDYNMKPLDESVLKQACISFKYDDDGDVILDEDGHGEISTFCDAWQGVTGFIYTADSVRFFIDNRRAIIDSLKEMIWAGCFESKGVVEAVASYGCLKQYKDDTEDELMEAIGRAVYDSSLTFDAVFDDNNLLPVVCEALAFGALEETFFNLQNSKFEEVEEEEEKEDDNIIVITSNKMRTIDLERAKDGEEAND